MKFQLPTNLCPTTRLLQAVALALAPVTLLAPQQLTAIFLIAGIGLLILNRDQLVSFLRSPGLIVAVFGTLILWGAVSSIWSIDGGASLKRALKLAGFLMLSAFALHVVQRLEPRARQSILNTLAVSVVILLILIAFERLSDKALTQMLTYYNWDQRHGILNRPMALLALLAWPVLATLWLSGRRKIAVALAAMLTVTLTGGRGATGLMSIAVGASILLLAWADRRSVAIGMAVPIIIFAFSAPWVLAREKVIQTGFEALPTMAYSAQQRLFIWEFTSQRILERPLLGHGLASSRTLPGARTPIPTALKFEDRPWTQVGGTWVTMGKQDVLPLHPHNSFLQLWLELGIGGIIAGLAVVLALIYRSMRNPQAPWALATLAATGMPLMLSFSLWQSWWIGFLALLAIFMTIATGPRDNEGAIPE